MAWKESNHKEKQEIRKRAETRTCTSFLSKYVDRLKRNSPIFAVLGCDFVEEGHKRIN